jgi:hypothetical protein
LWSSDGRSLSDGISRSGRKPADSRKGKIFVGALPRILVTDPNIW